MRTNYKAILWDCDGVLIDSEVLACTAAAEEVTAAGYPVSAGDFIARFMGKGLPQILKEIDAETAANLTENFDRERLRARQKKIFSDHLAATEGMGFVLAGLNVPMAVASGSELARLKHTLSLTGLLDYFDGHIYSVDMVEKGKPAADIFLYAAEKLGVAPQDCLVVEDGIHGIHAAHAAGMDVVAWLGGSHITSEIREQVLAAKPTGVLSCLGDLAGMTAKP